MHFEMQNELQFLKKKNNKLIEDNNELSTKYENAMK